MAVRAGKSSVVALLTKFATFVSVVKLFVASVPLLLKVVTEEIVVRPEPVNVPELVKFVTPTIVAGF